MRVKRISRLLCALFLLLAMNGCGKEAALESRKTEGLERLSEIRVVAREEGSGTRSSFAELVGFSEGVGSRPDGTRADAAVAGSTGEVYSRVMEDPSAIGYVSMGGLGKKDAINILRVNGAEPGSGNKAYPLSRTFYLAYCGRLNELEQDFLTYVHGAGQAIVAEDYIPVAKSSVFLSNHEKGSIRIGGSTSAAPLLERLAQGYIEQNPNAQITVVPSDSGTGLTGAMAGELDFGMSSRELKDYEAELLDYEAVARDEIAVIVNAENPLEDVTTEMLRKIFTGELQSWEELE